MALIGSLEAVKLQLQTHPVLNAVWSYLDHAAQSGSAAHHRILALTAGTTERVDLMDGAFALEQSYFTKALDASFFESHRAFIDIQVMIEGEELMEWVDVSRLTVKDDYVAQRDLLFYERFSDVSSLRVRAGEAAVFFPSDAHRPSLQIGQPARVFKTVVKVPVGIFQGRG